MIPVQSTRVDEDWTRPGGPLNPLCPQSATCRRGVQILSQPSAWLWLLYWHFPSINNIRAGKLIPPRCRVWLTPSPPPPVICHPRLLVTWQPMWCVTPSANKARVVSSYNLDQVVFRCPSFIFQNFFLGGFCFQDGKIYRTRGSVS